MADSLTSISGVSSGVDWKALVDSIMTLERRPAAKLETAIAANAKRKEALEQYRAAVAALKGAGDGLRDGSAFDAFTAATSGTDASGRTVASAVAGSGASPGTYTLSVTQLAQSQKKIGAVTFASAGTALGLTGRLVVGGQNVDLVSGDTLTAVRDKINAVSGTSQVQASLLADTTGGTQRLVLSGLKTGAAAAFTAADGAGNATSLVTALGLGGAPQVAATDALLRVDDTIDVARASNSFDDVIPGVSLSLSAEGTSTITVTRQDGAGATAVRAFVEAYNKLHTFVKTATEAGKGPLANDALLRTTRGSLSQAMLGAGGSGTAADLARLGAVGVTLTKDGTASFDAATWNAAYPARVSDVKKLLADRIGAVDTMLGELTATATGTIDRRTTAIGAQSDTMQLRISDIDARLDKKRTALLQQYSRSEALLGRLKTIGDALASQITSLANSSKN